MKVGLINRYYSPNPAITGESACGLVRELERALPDLKVTVYHVDAPYVGGVDGAQPAGELAIIPPVYSGRDKKLRLLGSLAEGARLARRAVRENDRVITLTDPPLVHAWVSLFSRQYKKPWVYWAMDLYPQAFAAAGLVGASNPLYRGLKGALKKNPPSFLIALGEQQAEFIQGEFGSNIPYAVLPCGLQNIVPGAVPAWKTDPEKLYLSYAGNLGEAHDAEFLVDVVECLDPEKHVAVIALYGAKASATLPRIAEHKAGKIVSSVGRAELGQVDVHLVSLLPEWSHVCVPSKAVSAVCAGSAFVFCGDEQADSWHMLQDAGWWLPAHGNREARKRRITEILAQLTPAALAAKRQRAFELKRHLIAQKQAAYKTLAAWLREPSAWELSGSITRSFTLRAGTPV